MWFKLYYNQLDADETNLEFFISHSESFFKQSYGQKCKRNNLHGSHLVLLYNWLVDVLQSTRQLLSCAHVRVCEILTTCLIVS